MKLIQRKSITCKVYLRCDLLQLAHQFWGGAAGFQTEKNKRMARFRKRKLTMIRVDAKIQSAEDWKAALNQLGIELRADSRLCCGNHETMPHLV